jgi:hypothetical protein
MGEATTIGGITGAINIRRHGYHERETTCPSNFTSFDERGFPLRGTMRIGGLHAHTQPIQSVRLRTNPDNTRFILEVIAEKKYVTIVLADEDRQELMKRLVDFANQGVFQGMPDLVNLARIIVVDDNFNNREESNL